MIILWPKKKPQGKEMSKILKFLCKLWHVHTIKYDVTGLSHAFKCFERHGEMLLMLSKQKGILIKMCAPETSLGIYVVSSYLIF